MPGSLATEGEGVKAIGDHAKQLLSRARSYGELAEGLEFLRLEQHLASFPSDRCLQPFGMSRVSSQSRQVRPLRRSERYKGQESSPSLQRAAIGPSARWRRLPSAARGAVVASLGKTGK